MFLLSSDPCDNGGCGLKPSHCIGDPPFSHLHQAFDNMISHCIEAENKVTFMLKLFQCCPKKSVTNFFQNIPPTATFIQDQCL